MEFVNVFLPVLMYSLLSVLIVVLIVLGIRLLETVNRVNKLLDDVEKKMDSMNGLFNVMDFVTTKATNVIPFSFLNMNNSSFDFFSYIFI